MKDLINPNLDLKKIHSSFKEKGYVVIDNYLKDDVAENLNNFFSNEMPTDWWSIATFPSKDIDRVSYFRNTPEEYDNIQKANAFIKYENPNDLFRKHLSITTCRGNSFA